jgi:flagellar basal body-associated protein FliL
MFDQNISVKVQDLLGEFLYQHKELSLPGIGRFELDSSVNVYESKEGNLPENAIRFTQHTPAVASDELMSYLVQHSRKMKPLAMSDLDSYINNGWQLLNIGKPFTIRGVGSLTKSGNTLSFQQGTLALDKAEVTGAYTVKDRTREKEEIKELNFDSEVKKGNGKKVMIAIASVAALALIAWAIYLAVPKNKNTATTEEETVQEDTAQQQTTADTTVTLITDSVTTAPAQVVDTSFQLVLFTFSDTAKANKELRKQLTKRNNVSVMQKDSVYQVLLTVNKPLADTAKVIDSLRSYYLLKPKLAKQ